MRLHIIGDSQACRCGGVYPSGTAFTNATTGVGVVDCKVGSRIADWNGHIDAVNVQSGDRALVFLGSNEMNSTPDPSFIINSLLSRGASVVWVGPPLIHDISGPFIAHVSGIVESLGVPYFDSRTLNLQQPDGIHPSPSEAARWLNAVLASQGWNGGAVQPVVVPASTSWWETALVAVVGGLAIGGAIHALFPRKTRRRYA